MSRLDTGGGAMTTYGRGGVPNVPRIGIDQQLNAPGVVPAPIDTSSAQTTEEFLSVFGLAGQFAAEQAAQQERIKARSEHEQRAIDQSLIGEGSKAGAIDLPMIDAAIQRGELAPVEGETSADFAKRIVSQRTAGQAPKYAEGYLRYADNIAASFENVKAKGIAAARGMALESASSAAVSSKTPEELQDAFNGAIAIPGVTELQAREKVYLESLRSAADDPNGRDRFNMILGVMGNKTFASEIERAKTQLETREKQAKSSREIATLNAIDGFYNNGGSLDATMDSIRRAEKHGHIDSTTARNYTELYANKAKQAQADAIKQQSKVEEVANRRKLAETAMQIMDSGDINGGSSAIAAQAPKTTFTTSDGKEHTVTADEIVESAWAKKRADIDAGTTDPAQRFLQRIDYMRKNTTLTDPEIEGNLRGISGRIGASMSLKDVPPVVVQGIEQYRQLVATGNQEIADRHARGNDRDFLRAVTFMASEVTGDVRSAAVDATIGMQKDPAFAESITRTLDSFELKNQTDFLVDKPGEVDARAAIERKARAYMMLPGGKTAQKAVAQAVQDFRLDHIDIGGYYVNARGFANRQNPNALQVSANAVVEAWTKSSGGQAGDFTLLPDNQRKTWDIRFKGIAIDPEAPKITDDDLALIYAETERLRQDQASLDAMAVARTTSVIFNPQDPLGLINKSVGAVQRFFGAGKDPGDAAKLPPAPEPPAHLKFVFDHLRKKEYERVNAKEIRRDSARIQGLTDLIERGSATGSAGPEQIAKWKAERERLQGGLP